MGSDRCLYFFDFGGGFVVFLSFGGFGGFVVIFFGGYFVV